MQRFFIFFSLVACEWLLFSQVESGDLVSYGLIPEFIGRFPILVSLLALNEDQLVQVNFSENSTLFSFS